MIGFGKGRCRTVDKHLGALLLSVAGTIFLLLAVLIALVRNNSTQPQDSRQWSSVTTAKKNLTKSAASRSVSIASVPLAPMRSELETLIRKEYEKSLTMLRAKFVDELNQLIRKTRDTYYLSAERDAFIERDILPVLPAAQPAVNRYVAAVAEADRKLEKELDRLK